jgi:hypothetical protein
VTDLYAITAEEQAKYTAFSMTMWRQLVRPLPQTLWYYTNAPTFGRILKTGEVWSTQISCLNDHSEIRYAVRRLRDEIKTMSGTATSTLASWPSIFTKPLSRTAPIRRGSSCSA